MRKRTVISVILAATLAAAMSVTAFAATNPFAATETQSRQAVDAAVKAGKVPQGTTIYDCMYGSDKNGVTIVIQYRDADGNWIDVVTQKKAENKSDNTAISANKPTEKQLEEYEFEVLRLVNKERQKAGLNEVVWDDDFAACARIRAEELQYRYSHYRPVEPTAGNHKWPVLTHGKAGVYNCPSVADEQGVDYTCSRH